MGAMKFVNIRYKEHLQTASQIFAEDDGRPVEVTLAFYLDEQDDDSVDSLVAVLKTAKNVKMLLVETDLFPDRSTITTSKLESLRDAIANIQGLQSIGFQGSPFKIDPRSFRFMSHFIQRQAKTLKKLWFCLGFAGSNEDFKQFGSALAECKGLTHLDFDKSFIPNKLELFENVNPVLGAISSIPKPTWLDFQCWIPKGKNYPNGVGPPSASLLLPLAQALAHPLLHEMEISDSRRLKSIALSMQHHKTGPKSLTLYTSLRKEDLEDISCIVANSGERVKTIKWIIHGKPSVHLDFHSIVAALAKNSSLKAFVVQFGEAVTLEESITLSPAFLDGLANMLETENWTLTKLGIQISVNYRLNDVQFTLPPRIKHNLKLNWLGRTKVLQQDPNLTDREDWIWKLYRSRNDIDCLFYFLSMNPFLCDDCGEAKKVQVVGEGSIATRTRKRRKVSSV